MLCFAKIISFIKEKQNICSFFYREKRTKKAPSFVKRSKTTPFRIRNSLVKIFSQYLESPSLRGSAEAIYINWIATPTSRLAMTILSFAHAVRLALRAFATAMTIKNKFANLNNNGALAHCVQTAKVVQGVETPCYKKWIASLISFVRNDKFNYIHAFSCALKNKFEIISQSDYGFCYKNYFFNLNQVFRNSYDFGERFGRNLNYDFEKNRNGSFGKNYFGNCNFGFDFWNEICGIGNNLAGFLFNRKILKTKI